ncbi:MAG TPA: type II toxin-antitoxin system RelE/ParE family toxin [Pyrinomonadaceae bacterium]|nr:type II toxin-antitoxin system RelE/ParE family toxin [Pyrinomonadaceae bacterium]
MPDQAYYCAVDEPHIINRIVWVGSSLKDLRLFPAEVKDVMGYALYQAQVGSKAPSAKPLTGFGGASVLEIVDDYESDTYRAVYTVKFPGVVYVLHVFQKKSKKGITMPRPNMELIRKRLKVAEEDYRERHSARRDR